jgi:two-component system sensor histidine kinase YesM
MKFKSFLLREKQRLLDFKISIKISIFYSFLIIITIIISLFLYQKLHIDVMSEKIEEVSIQTLSSINSNINSTIENINNCSKMIISDDDVRIKLNTQNTSVNSYTFTNNYNANSMDDVDFFYELRNLIYEFPNISAVYIIDNNGNLYASDKNSEMSLLDSNIENAPWYSNINDKEGGYVLSLNAGGVFDNKFDESFVSLIRIIRDIEKPVDKNGTLILNISNKALASVYSDVVDGSDMGIAIYDENNDEIISNKELDKKHVNRIIKEAGDDKYYSRIDEIDGVQYVESYLNTDEYNWKIVSIITFDELSSESDSVSFIVFLIIVINVIMFLIGGLFVSRIITNPITKLMKSMKKIENKQFELVELSGRRDEIGNLKLGYNLMIKEIKNLLEKTVSEQKLKRKVELNALQQQVKPHFLYNTLDALGYMAISEGNEKLYEALEALGSYYRNSLSKGREIITIKEEIQIVKSYLILQNIRYGKIITSKFDIDESLNDYKILKMVLQPLVENSIYHGIKPKGEEGIIYISIKELKYINFKNRIKIIIEDDGVGMEKNLVKSLNSQEIDYNDMSFGIKGTIQRLRIFYGDSGNYTIESEKRKGTKIMIVIPAERRR